MNTESFTGRHRARRTSLGVRVAEHVSKALITVGGIGTILAVTLILVFLVWVVVPLFRDAAVERGGTRLSGAFSRPLLLATDEHRLMDAVLDAAGVLRVFAVAEGALLLEERVFEPPPTAWSVSPDGLQSSFAFADGTVLTGGLVFTASMLDEDAVPAELAALAAGQVVRWGRGLADRTSEGRIRVHEAGLRWDAPLDLGVAAPVRLVDVVATATKTLVSFLTEAGELGLLDVRTKKNLLTGGETRKTSRFPIELDELEPLGPPAAALLLGGGEDLLLVWSDGAAARVDLQDPQAPRVAERLDLLPGPGVAVTALSLQLGRATLLVGDSAGGLGGWFRVRSEEAGTLDGTLLVRAHELAAGGAPVTALAPSPRSRLALAGRADGRITLHHVTEDRLLAETAEPVPGRLLALAFAPKQDGIVALSDSTLANWELDARHPEASLAGLFTPVWYEDYPGPEHVWQSSSGTDDTEPKLGLVPLIFGTLKATIYSMAFAVPIALLAAIYTSEFLHRRIRTQTKSVIETMASLPSVVLGFLVALVIAPFVQEHLTATLAAFVTIPFTVLAGAYLWQMLPRRVAVRQGGWPKLATILVTLPGALLLARAAGPLLERWMFAGDVFLWLDGQVGSSIGGWTLLLLPLSAFAVVLLHGRLVGPWIRARSLSWTREQCARTDLVRFLVGTALALLLSFVAGVVLDGLSLDPRGGVMDTYVQRNALVVGFVMGFAVVPIIYTLAEDALSSVPQHLRQASMGAGATPWQTAARVVIPTAMSGLFSAVMVGLGRAVGETMIVLMATGNTPVMEWNVFSGFRTLSANLAFELPEAVQNSTHYRTLFLAALVLFAMTFALNTVAEVVRQRFRRRAYQL